MAQAFSRLPLTAEGRIQSQARHLGFCDGQIGSGTDFILSTSVFSGHKHSTGALCSFSCLSPTLDNLSD